LTFQQEQQAMRLDRGFERSAIDIGGWTAAIRNAEPDDSAFIARAILMASRAHLGSGLWDLVVAGHEQDRLDFIEFLTLMEARSFCSYENFLIAEDGGQPVAAMAGYDPGENGLLSPGHLIGSAFELFGWSDAELGAAYARLEPFQAGLPEQKKGVWTIEWVATLPSARRRGLAARLMDLVLAEGHSRGLKQAQVTTVIGNEAAIAGYEKAGFRVAERKLDERFASSVGAPGMVRLERPL
jgi:ribosomal protein S18 acetylase RimI-like enzyme